MDNEEKISKLQAMCDGSPDDFLAFFMLGRELLTAKRYDDAAKALAECCAIKPDYTAAYRHWGDALRKADRTQEAINVYEKGIAVSEETGDLQAGKEMQVFLDKLKG
jgi:tetratricopeptide (TPR) repeat protein